MGHRNGREALLRGYLLFSGWWNRRDSAHDRVQEFLGGYSARLLTTRWVLMEVADGFASSRMRCEVRRLFAEMEGDGQITIVEHLDSLYRRGLDLYDARPDKERSLTDCISFVVMADEGLTEALTGDGHFTQAGFKALLA